MQQAGDESWLPMCHSLTLSWWTLHCSFVPLNQSFHTAFAGLGSGEATSDYYVVFNWRRIVIIIIFFYSGLLLSHKRNEVGSFVETVDEPRNCHTESSKSEREQQILYMNAYKWSLEKWYS